MEPPQDYTSGEKRPKTTGIPRATHLDGIPMHVKNKRSLPWSTIGALCLIVGWFSHSFQIFAAGILLLAIAWRIVGGRVFHQPVRYLHRGFTSLRAASPPGPASPKSPLTACILSLLLPGCGQLYCRKTGRGLWTAGVFLLVGSVASARLLSQSSGFDTEDSWVGLWIIALVVHVFAVLDAYFTAREISCGLDPYVIDNPRVAAVLNLLTGWVGYSYLGERRKAFWMLGIAIVLGPTGIGALLFPIVAYDAYRIARKEVKNNIAALPPRRQTGQQPSRFGAALAVALSGVIVLGYCGSLVVLVPTEELAVMNEWRDSFQRVEDLAERLDEPVSESEAIDSQEVASHITQCIQATRSVTSYRSIRLVKEADSSGYAVKWWSDFVKPDRFHGGQHVSAEDWWDEWITIGDHTWDLLLLSLGQFEPVSSEGIRTAENDQMRVDPYLQLIAQPVERARLDRHDGALYLVLPELCADSA